MGFLDKAKAAATDLGNQAKGTVDGAQTKKKANDLFHDLGVLTWAQSQGQAVDQDELGRVNGELAAIAGQGPLDMSIKTAPQQAPPPPASAGGAAAPPPPGGVAAPPPPGGVAPPPAPGEAAAAPPAPAAAAPPAPAAATPPPPPPAGIEPPPPPASMG
jgi:hypothetical protein